MTKLIINADDFGYSVGVNLGIVEAHQHGIITSTSLMPNMPAIIQAAALAKQHPKLGVGIHFVLTCGTPLSKDVPSLTKADGSFLSRSELEAGAPNPFEVEREFRAQLAQFLSLGLIPTHFDSHHHVHMLEAVFPVVEKLALEMNVPLRKARTTDIQISPTTDTLNCDFYGEHLSQEILLEIFDQVQLYDSAEIMTHPALVDQPLLNGSSYAVPRANELAILTTSEARQAILDYGFQLITWRELP